MKAAVLRQYGTIPVYQDFPDPQVTSDDEVLISPVASSIKQLDLSKAAGTHYTKFASMPTVVGTDGVGLTEDGKRIYATGMTGMMAQHALVKKQSGISIPDGLDNATAAALPNTLVGSDLALLEKGRIKPGDTVLVDGATGATGSMAVQMAKIHGAQTVIVTGRNPEKLAYLKTLGADMTINLKQEDSKVIADLINAYREAPFDVIIDYLWGRPAELIMTALSKVKSVKPMKFISVGGLDNPEARVASQLFRSKHINLLGSGIGSFSPQVLQEYLRANLVNVYNLVLQNRIIFHTNTFSLEDISKAWTHAPAVVMINH